MFLFFNILNTHVSAIVNLNNLFFLVIMFGLAVGDRKVFVQQEVCFASMSVSAAPSLNFFRIILPVEREAFVQNERLAIHHSY